MKRSRLWSAALVAGMLLFSVSGTTVYSQDLGTPGTQSEEETNSPAEGGEEQFVFADDVQGGSDGDNVEPAQLNTFGVWDLLRMIVVLLLVVASVYGVVALLRRRVHAPTRDEESPIRVLASKTLSANQELHAVMIGRQVLILGGGDSGLQLITRVEDQETIDELVLAHSSGTSGRSTGRTFGAVLAQWLGNAAVPGVTRSRSNEETDTSQLSFLKTQQNRLRKLR